MQDPELWARIEDYDFPRGFEDKLAAEFGGWQGTARRLREEYRRFVYLAVISRQEVTPSEPVDRVWHLHLSYTRDYWERFCPKVLRQDFHHDPCESPAEMPRYDAQYAQALALYEREFGEAPPLRIWPTGALRRRFWWGVGVGVLGILVGVLALVLGDQGPSWRIALALVLITLGFGWAVWSSPVGANRGAGCGGTAGCGGGGCGGGGGG